jgi:hypothetical protein
MQIADSTLVFDNSGLERRLLLHVEDGVAKFVNDDRPAWFDTAVPERMWRFNRSISSIRPPETDLGSEG